MTNKHNKCLIQTKSISPSKKPIYDTGISSNKAGLFSSIKSKHDIAVSNQLSPDEEAVYNSLGLIVPPYSKQACQEAYTLNSTHQTCCNTKAHDIAGRGLSVVPCSDTLNKVTEQLLKDFLKKCSSKLTKVFTSEEREYAAYGVSSVEILREGGNPNGKPIDIKHLSVRYLDPHGTRTKFYQRIGVNDVWFQAYGCNVDADGNKFCISKVDGSEHIYTEKKLPNGTMSFNCDLSKKLIATEVYFFEGESITGSIYGTPVVLAILKDIMIDDLTKDLLSTLRSSLAVAPFIATLKINCKPSDLYPGTTTSYQEYYTNCIRSLVGENANFTLILIQKSSVAMPNEASDDNDFKLEQLQISTSEASFAEGRKVTDAAIRQAHLMPIYRLGGTEQGSLGGNVAFESAKNYKNTVIEVRQCAIEDFLEKIATELGVDDYKFKFDDIDAEDTKLKLEIFTAMFNNKIIDEEEFKKAFAKDYGLSLTVKSKLTTEEPTQPALTTEPIKENVIITDEATNQEANIV